LHFTLLEVYVGTASIAIRYSNQVGRLGTEVFFFNHNGLVVRAAAHYFD
jgi:hypothetical protein